MIPSPDGQFIWVSTADSSIKKWPVNSRNVHMGNSDGRNMDDFDIGRFPPINQQPDQMIKGNKTITQYIVLPDKRHIITKDSENHVILWDILKASKVKDLGTVDFEGEVVKRYKMLYVPDWFSVDLKTGMLRIKLSEPNSFAAWVSAKDLELYPDDIPDTTVNLGSLLLKSLLQNWSATHKNDDECEKALESNHSSVDEKHKPGSSLSIPEHTPVIFSEVHGRTLLRLLVREAGRERENLLLHETVPQWVTDVTISKNIPEKNKIVFHLLPLSASGVPLQNTKLSAQDTLKVIKIIEYVHKKLGAGSSASSQIKSGNSGSQEKTEEERDDEQKSIAAHKFQLLCQDHILNCNLDLRTVKYFMWDSPDELVLNYRPVQ